MCGIWFYRSGAPIVGAQMKKLRARADKIKHRGPDATRVTTYSHAMLVFHRLQIVDPHPEGMQPFVGTSPSKKTPTFASASIRSADTVNADIDMVCEKRIQNTWTCMINGEIYNYRALYEKIHGDYKPKSHSDCEVVFSLFLTYLLSSEDPYEALRKVICDIDGEYAIVLYNVTEDYVIAVTDELRMRPLFVSLKHVGEYLDLYITSEQKAGCRGAIPLTPGAIHVFGNSCEFALRTAFPRFDQSVRSKGLSNLSKYGFITVYESPVRWHEVPRVVGTIDSAAAQLRQLLIGNVHAKMHLDRNYGFLLSGGIDSSLVCGIAARYCRDHELPRIRTFTVGFSPAAPDIIAARKVAAHIESIHEEIIVPYEVGLGLIEEVVRALESWDQTTVRASIPMMIVAKYIKARHPDIAVVYSGEVADELLRGYLYNRTEVSESTARADMIMRLGDISMFDGLRADRVIASQGMEVRFPFFSRALLQFVFSLPGELLDPVANGGVEKMLLRKAFDGAGIIPQEIIWRTKNAFSDATSVMVGKIGSQWKEMLKANAELHVTAERFERRDEIYPGAQIQTREDMYYRDIFDSYGYNHEAIPYKWLPSWVDGVTDSSATVLSVFTAN